MPALTRWDPFSDLMNLREAMDRVFSDAFTRTGRLVGGGEGGEMTMPMDIVEDAESVTVKALLPGVKPDEVEISVTGDVVSIRAETRSETETKDATTHRREIRYGTYARAFTLPSSVRSDAARATFENGVLTLRLPKAEEVKPKRIPIHVTGQEIVADTATPSQN